MIFSFLTFEIQVTVIPIISALSQYPIKVHRTFMYVLMELSLGRSFTLECPQAKSGWVSIILDPKHCRNMHDLTQPDTRNSYYLKVQVGFRVSSFYDENCIFVFFISTRKLEKARLEPIWPESTQLETYAIFGFKNIYLKYMKIDPKISENFRLGRIDSDRVWLF